MDIRTRLATLPLRQPTMLCIRCGHPRMVMTTKTVKYVFSKIIKFKDQVMLSLLKHGLYKDSIILFTTDNGGGPWYSNRSKV